MEYNSLFDLFGRPYVQASFATIGWNEQADVFDWLGLLPDSSVKKLWWTVSFFAGFGGQSRADVKLRIR